MRRSRSRWYDFPLRLFGKRAYRCMLCDRRFYGSKQAMVATTAGQAG
ncbi:MAG TPA: hypothetical protein VL990_10735 [Acidobacteriaceae bacterium]|nr:hypothetical protein [Acidobacteriaceae bacterium]